MNFIFSYKHKLIFSFLLIVGICLECPNSYARLTIEIDESKQVPLQEALYLNLISAIEEGSIGKVKYLINDGIEISSEGKYGTKPLLHYATAHLEITNFLIENGLNVNAIDSYDNTALHNFIEDPEVVRALVEANAHVNAIGRHGNRPLHYAARNPEATKTLLDADANPKVKDKFGSTPLHNVTDVETARYLIEAGANVNALTNRDNRKLLTSDNTNFAQILRRGANHYDWRWRISDVVARNGHNITPLHNAMSPELAQLLIDSGADIEATTDKLETPLHFAIERENLEVAEVLIRTSANVHARNHAGQTPLHLAEHAKSVDILVDANANTEAKDDLGQTSLHYV